MKILGITGGIACGKSFATRLFRTWGTWTASADEDARVVVEPGSPTLTAVFDQFPEVRAADGTLDRARLATRIFNDTEARLHLESILHPAIFDRMNAAIKSARISDAAPLFAYEVPLLFEKKREPNFDATLAVICSSETQARRLQERERIAGRVALAGEDIAKRLSAQFSNEEKARHATYVIHTDGTEADTEQQARAVWEAFVGFAPNPTGSDSAQNTV